MQQNPELDAIFKIVHFCSVRLKKKCSRKKFDKSEDFDVSESNPGG